MFGIQDQLVFLISNSQCRIIKKLLFFSLRSLRKLLPLMLRFLPKLPKDTTEQPIEEKKLQMTLKLLVLLATTELLNLLKKLLSS